MDTERILLAGANRLDALDLQQRMSRMGHRVLAVAHSSDEALHLAAVRRPDIVVMDLRVPGLIGGIQASTQIWAQLGIPVIYVSEHFLEGRLLRLWPTALAGLLSKHTTAGDLHHAIEEMLGRRPPRSPIPSPTVLKGVGPLHFTKTDDEPGCCDALCSVALPALERLRSAA
jgi:DNA-binding NarL/FixJ family response regulator